MDENEFVYGWYHYQDGADVMFRYPTARENDLREDGKRVTVEINANGWGKRVGYVVETNGNYLVIPSSASNAAAALGKLGGSSRSEAKQNASRNNGKKGGRPKK